MFLKRTSTIQTNGQVTLPAEFRERFGLRQGDTVVFQATDNGILVNTPEATLTRLLDEIGESMRQEGVSLEEWMGRGREIRARLLKEKYDIDADSDAA